MSTLTIDRPAPEIPEYYSNVASWDIKRLQEEVLATVPTVVTDTEGATPIPESPEVAKHQQRNRRLIQTWLGIQACGGAEPYHNLLVSSAKLVSSRKAANPEDPQNSIPTSVRVLEIGRFNQNLKPLPLASKLAGLVNPNDNNPPKFSDIVMSGEGSNASAALEPSDYGVLGKLNAMQEGLKVACPPQGYGSADDEEKAAKEIRSAFKDIAEAYIEALPEEAHPGKVTFDSRKLGPASLPDSLLRSTAAKNRELIRNRVGQLRGERHQVMHQNKQLHNSLKKLMSNAGDTFIASYQGIDGYIGLSRFTGWGPQKTFMNISALCKAAGLDMDKLGWQQLHMKDSEVKPSREFLEGNFDAIKGMEGYLWVSEESGWGPQKTFKNISALCKAAGLDMDELGWQALYIRLRSKTKPRVLRKQLRCYQGHGGWPP